MNFQEKKINFRTELLRVVKQVLDNEVSRNDSFWPPICMGLLHQPKRPVREEKVCK